VESVSSQGEHRLDARHVPRRRHRTNPQHLRHDRSSRSKRRLVGRRHAALLSASRSKYNRLRNKIGECTRVRLLLSISRSLSLMLSLSLALSLSHSLSRLRYRARSRLVSLPLHDLHFTFAVLISPVCECFLFVSNRKRSKQFRCKPSMQLNRRDPHSGVWTMLSTLRSHAQSINISMMAIADIAISPLRHFVSERKALQAQTCHLHQSLRSFFC